MSDREPPAARPSRAMAEPQAIAPDFTQPHLMFAISFRPFSHSLSCFSAISLEMP